jgi:hypothetical protein
MPGREYKQPERMDGLENLWGGCRQEPFSPPERLLPDLVLNRCVPLFARPDPHRGFNRNDKDLSVTVSSRLCRRNNELHDFAGVAVAYYHLDFHLGQKSSRSLIASQRLEPTFLPPKAPDLGDRHSADSHFGQSLLDRLQFEGFDDGFDLFH